MKQPKTFSANSRRNPRWLQRGVRRMVFLFVMFWLRLWVLSVKCGAYLVVHGFHLWCDLRLFALHLKLRLLCFSLKLYLCLLRGSLRLRKGCLHLPFLFRCEHKCKNANPPNESSSATATTNAAEAGQNQKGQK